MKKNIRYIISAVVVITIIAVGVYFCFGKEKKYSASDYAMGTVISVNLYGGDGENIAEDIFSSIKNTEKYISRNIKSSDISLINEKGKSECNDLTVDILKKALDVCENSGGALDITLGKLTDLWNVDGEKPKIPDENDIKTALENSGYEKIKIDGNSVCVPDGVNIDLGAVGKGKGADDAYAVLKNSDVTGGIVSVGGTVLVYGENPKNDCWTVGIRTPEADTSDYFATLKIYENSFISTSGSYEKYFSLNGEIYHHIMDAETGYPAKSGIKSVTVVCDNGLYADALSTACFVLGYDKSISLLEKYNAQAIFVFDDNTVKCTDNIEKDLNIIDNEYSIEK